MELVHKSERPSDQANFGAETRKAAPKVGTPAGYRRPGIGSAHPMRGGREKVGPNSPAAVRSLAGRQSSRSSACPFTGRPAPRYGRCTHENSTLQLLGIY